MASRTSTRRLRTSRGHRTRARLHGDTGPIQKKARRRALIGKIVIVLAVIASSAMVGQAYATNFVNGLPSVAGLDAAKFGGDIIVTDRNGGLMADVGDNGNHRLIVPLDRMSPFVIKATVAVEDKNFYKNKGFDLAGIIRAGLSDYRSGSLQSGGSTITQQLAKQLFLSPERTWQRKVKELILAYQLTQKYSKDQILDLYLNRTYYGSQAYGVQAAAKQYFQKDATQLDLAQSALIAGLPQAPSDYDPVQHPDAAKQRQHQVLQAMLNNDFITPAQYDQAVAEKMAIKPPKNTFLAPHFVKYVENELEKLGFHPGGQQIFVQTTLDMHLQNLAQRVVRQNLDANRWRDPDGKLQSAMVAMDPKTGQIFAMIGSYDYNSSTGGQYNFTDLPVNPGSSVKVFTYAAALAEKKATMETRVYDGPPTYWVHGFWGWYPARNYDLRAHGVLPVRETLPNSLNIAAVKVEMAVGIPNVVRFYRNIGIYPRGFNGSPNANPSTGYSPPLTLGSFPITLVEEATGLSTVADLGVYHAPEAILKITDARGKVLYQANAARTARQAFDAGAAYIEAQILANDYNRALIFGLNSPLHLGDRHSAAKTGTTDDFKDALTIGFTPHLASVFWVGDILGIHHSMVSGSDGVFVAAPAWHSFMEQALQGKKDEWYTAPPDVVQKGNDYYLLDAQYIPELTYKQAAPPPSPVFTTPSPITVVVSPGYKIPSPPPGQPVEPVPSPTPSDTPPPLPGGGRQP